MSAKPGETGIVTRRIVLTTAPAVCVGNAAWAQTPPKFTREAALYQDTPRGGLSCVGCTFFRRPRSCQVVAGDISANGWCRLFDLPD
jgi:hypothetical protein